MTPHTATARSIDLCAHFGLHGQPFTREFSIERRFSLPLFDDSIGALRSTIEDRMSGAIIGPAGTGKSVVLRAVKHGLPEARYRVCYLHVTSLSKRDFCRHLAQAIGAAPAGHTAALVAAIQERATALTEQDALRPVILIDESHDLRPDVLGLVRLLTNFEIDSRLVISVILAGQPGLRTLLRRDELEAVRGRIAHLCTLRLLTRDESRAYVRHRMAIAGATDEIFEQRALDALFEVSQGNLRALDTVAFKALQEAAADGASLCTDDHVVRARARVAA